jgi:hypothetical protein
VPVIVHGFNRDALRHLDLSMNRLDQLCALSVAEHFKRTNVLEYLDLSYCNLHCSEIATICVVLSSYDNCLTEFHLTSNKISKDGAQEICRSDFL